jgi:hypothetical protein
LFWSPCTIKASTRHCCGVDLLVLIALNQEGQHPPLLRRQLGGALGDGVGGVGGRRCQDLAVEHGANRAGDLLERSRLVDIGRGAEVEGAARNGGLARRRDDDDRNCRVLRAQQGKPAEAVHAGHVEVEQQGIGLGLPDERRPHLGEASGQSHCCTCEGVAERRVQCIANHRMVVGDQERPRRARQLVHVKPALDQSRGSPSLSDSYPSCSQIGQ